MAPTRRSAGQERVRLAKPAEKQSKTVLWICYVGIPLAVTSFILGCGGVAVLMDEPDRAHWYSQTKFADTWRWLTEKNPFYMTICVNGGMVVTLFLGTKLFEHHKALKEEKKLQKRVKKAQKTQ